MRYLAISPECEKKPKSGNIRGRGRNNHQAGKRRVNLIGRDDDQSDASSETQEDNVVLHLEGKQGHPPFVMKGNINEQPFPTMIDSGSPISIFTRADLRKLLRTDVIFARPLPKNESYVDYNNQPIKPTNLVGFSNMEVQEGKRKITNARIVITRDGKRSIIGRDWLAQLNYHVGEANSNRGYNNVLGHIKTSERKTLNNKY